MRFGFASEEDDGNLVVTGCGHVISPYSFSVVSSPFFYSITVVDYPWPTVAEVIIHSTQLRERCARRVAGVSRHQLRCSWPLIAGLRLKTMIYLIKPWFCIVSQAFCYTVAHYPRSSIISEARNSDRSAGFVLRRVSKGAKEAQASLKRRCNLWYVYRSEIGWKLERISFLISLGTWFARFWAEIEFGAWYIRSIEEQWFRSLFIGW